MPKTSIVRGFSAAMINLAQLLILMLAMLLASAFGIHFSKSLGRWTMIPAYIIGSYLMFIGVASLARDIRKQVRDIRERGSDGTRK